jgi:hypothetical protein
MTPLLRTFYLVPIITLVSVGVGGTLISVEPRETVYWLRVAAVVAAIAVALVVLMASLRQSESMVERARDIGGDRFAGYVARVREEAPQRLKEPEMNHSYHD